MITRISIAALLTVASALAVLSTSACAAATPLFNPDGLPSMQLARVEQVCQSVIGLSPTERLSGGEWLDNQRLDHWTSHYRGCVTSLSDTVQNVGGVLATQQADRDCRAKGYAEGTPDLALCVLQTSRQSSGATDQQQAPVVPSQRAESLPTASGSFFYASPHETRRREQVACAALGIEPTRNAFDACVEDLQHTFHAIDTPIT